MEGTGRNTAYIYCIICICNNDNKFFEFDMAATVNIDSHVFDLTGVVRER